MDLIKQFFSFDKFMKDRLVAAFFYLGVFAIIIAFFVTLRSAFAVMGYSPFYASVLLGMSIFQTLFLFVVLRLAAELMIAVFHINDNLSPDGGKAETAGLDIVDATLKAAGKAAKTATVATKSVVNKTKSTINDIRDSDDDGDYPDYEDPTPKPKSTRKAKPAAKKPSVKPKTVKPKAKTPAAKKSPAKTTARKPAAKKKPAAPRKKPTPKS